VAALVRRLFLEEVSTMKARIIGTSLAAVLLIGGAVSAAEVKSGPQVGQLLTPFHPLHCTGKQADQKVCLV
jgi:hypothetical protein